MQFSLAGEMQGINNLLITPHAIFSWRTYTILLGDIFPLGH